MKEYFGDSAKGYGETKGTRYLLIPAIARQLRRISGTEKTMLDVACGQGVLYPIALELGFAYTGIDVSPDLISVAREDWADGDFRIGDAREFSTEESFSVVVVSMLLPSLSSKAEIIAVLTRCRDVLTDDGLLVLGVTHPCFDYYIQHGVLGLEKNIQTEFKGYFDSGAKFIICDHPTTKGTFSFTDYHWTWTDYLFCIRESGFVLDEADECQPAPESQQFSDFWERRNKFPTRLVLSCRKH